MVVGDNADCWQFSREMRFPPFRNTQARSVRPCSSLFGDTRTKSPKPPWTSESPAYQCHRLHQNRQEYHTHLPEEHQTHQIKMKKQPGGANTRKVLKVLPVPLVRFPNPLDIGSDFLSQAGTLSKFHQLLYVHFSYNTTPIQ